MAVLQLRHHNPIAAPGRREPVDGTETDLRVSLGFEPAWFHHRLGIDFSERWHQDPFYRYESLTSMKQALNQAFPSMTEWNTDRQDLLATLSGCYGAYLIAGVFGLPLIYAPDRWPYCDPGSCLTIKEIESLEVDSLLKAPLVEDLWRQMEIIEAEWGTVYGYLNWQGVLNNAFQVRGQEIFLDLYKRPELAGHLFSVIRRLLIRLAKMVQSRQRRSGFYIDQLSVSNCVLNMISPELYRRFLLPHDRKIAESFERFGLHTCNWDITRYLDVFKELPRLGYLDMGLDTDLRRVKLNFPETRLAVIYWPTSLQDESLENIFLDLQRIYRELAPCDLVMADIQWTTPDRRINDFLALSRGLETGLLKEYKDLSVLNL